MNGTAAEAQTGADFGATNGEVVTNGGGGGGDFTCRR